MRIKIECYNEETLDAFGFHFYAPEECDHDEDDDFILANRFICKVGHSRRGQFYYLLIDPKTREIRVYASRPDGDGGPIDLGDELLKMFVAGVVELGEGENGTLQNLHIREERENGE